MTADPLVQVFHFSHNDANFFRYFRVLPLGASGNMAAPCSTREQAFAPCGGLGNQIVGAKHHHHHANNQKHNAKNFYDTHEIYPFFSVLPG
jgi:hypothetical protein